MPLDDLYTAVQKTRQRIGDYSPYLEENEFRTRQVLIDPILGALGWQVSDPGTVELEVHPKHAQSAKQERADYALKSDDNTVAVIEAKKLGTTFTPAMVRQVTNYADDDGIRFAILTDGNHWRVYDLHLTAPIAERIVVEFQIDEDPINKSAMLCLALWRPNLHSDFPNLDEIYPDLVELLCKDLSGDCEHQECEIPEDGDWISINDPDLSPSDKSRPKKLKDYKGREVDVGSWADVYRKVALALVRDSILTKEKCPVIAKSARTNCLVNSRKYHQSGSEMTNPDEFSPGFYIDLTVSAPRALKNCIQLLEALCVEPSKVKVLLR